MRQLKTTSQTSWARENSFKAFSCVFSGKWVTVMFIPTLREGRTHYRRCPIYTSEDILNVAIVFLKNGASFLIETEFPVTDDFRPAHFTSR